MKKSTKQTLAALTALLLASAELSGCSFSSAAKPHATRQMPVVTAPVKTSEIGGGEMFSGSVTAAVLSNLSSKLGGKVTDIKVTVGQRVKKGQALASLDTSSLNQQLAQAQSSADVQKAQLSKAESDHQSGVLSAQRSADLAQAQYDKTLSDQQNAVNAAKQQAALAQAQLSKAEADQANAVASAKQAVALAQTQLDKARTDAQNALNSAQTSVDVAQAGLSNAQGNAALNIKQLQANVDSARHKLTLAKDPTSAAQAQAELTAAELALSQAQGAPASLTQAQSQLQTAQAQLSAAQNSNAVAVAQQQYNQALLQYATASSQSNAVATEQFDQAQQSLQNAQTAAGTTKSTSQAQLAQAQQSLATAQSTDGLTVSQAQLAQALTNVHVYQEQLQDGVLTSPVDGIVTAINTPVGQMSGGQGGILTVASTDPTQVTVNVPEAELGKVKVGTAMTVNIPTLAKTFPGKVLAIHPTLDPTTKSYGVDVQVTDESHELLPGMFAEVTLKSQGRQGILVPADAVLSEPTGNSVFVVRGGKAAKVKVTLGDVNSTEFEIKSGLQVGDQLVVEGQELLSQDVPVKEVKPSSDAAKAGGDQ